MAVDFPSMPQGDQVKVITSKIELVDNPLVARPKAKLRTPLEAMMRKTLQTPSPFADFRLNPFPNRGRKGEENRVELRGVDLRGWRHGSLRLTHPDPTILQIRLAAFDAGDEVRLRFGLIFEVIGQPFH